MDSGRVSTGFQGFPARFPRGFRGVPEVSGGFRPLVHLESLLQNTVKQRFRGFRLGVSAACSEYKYNTIRKNDTHTHTAWPPPLSRILAGRGLR